MDFSCAARQRERQERARAPITEVADPIAKRVPAGGKLGLSDLQELYRGLAPTGYVGRTIPQDAGGAGLSYADYRLRVAAPAASPIILSEVVPPRSIFHLGSAEQKERWLPRLLAG